MAVYGCMGCGRDTRSADGVCRHCRTKNAKAPRPVLRFIRSDDGLVAPPTCGFRKNKFGEGHSDRQYRGDNFDQQLDPNSLNDD